MLQEPQDIVSRTYLIHQQPQTGSYAEVGPNVVHDISDIKYTKFPDGTSVGWKAAENFLQDYPNSYATGKQIDSLLTHKSVFGQLMAVADQGVIFVLLDRVNDPTINLRPERKQPGFQYEIRGEESVEKLSTPSVNFRTLITHELVHHDIKEGQERLDSELEASFQRVDDKNNNGAVGFKMEGGFSIFPVADSNKTIVKVRLDAEELMADYFSFKVSSLNGLSYRPGNGNSPVDIFNFEKVLKQAGIQDEELYRMHQEGNVKGFLTKIANGAKGIEFKNDEERLDFGVESFFYTDGNEGRWSYLEPYFDGLRIEPKKASRKKEDGDLLMF